MIRIFIFYLLLCICSCITAREGSNITYSPKVDTRLYKDYNNTTDTDTDLSVDFSKNTNK